MPSKNNGFTLVEILIALALSSVTMTAIYQTYYSQQRAYLMQQSATAMRQNLRVGMFLMVREIRMAGYDPSGGANAGIVAISTAPASIRFTMDLNGDADTDDSGENIRYSLYTAADGNRKLGRKSPTLNRPVAEHIEALDFVFYDARNLPTVTASEVRSVQVTLVVRAAMEDKNYRNNGVYKNRQGAVIFQSGNDGFRHMMLSTHIKIRNLGL